MGDNGLAFLLQLRATANFNMALAIACIVFSIFLFLVIPYQVEKPRSCSASRRAWSTRLRSRGWWRAPSCWSASGTCG